MGQKSSLALYRAHKATISAEKLYNSYGSALLFEGRASAPHTRVYRRHFDRSLEGSTVQCRACGEDEENIEHIVLQCDRLRSHQPDGTTLPEALSLVMAPIKKYSVRSTRTSCWRGWPRK
ncbi:hypothetical protein HPB50_008195 [Hyalomma asiaticum]|uniref:Uncharacterized protein n=1 Tax=Hyalomma asiaticum TaxID=266040 RepID=A0ACB7SCE8_HYAAI|nr:hypothetical protein HPB50_008195 [Hyalomma asiaticum]